MTETMTTQLQEELEKLLGQLYVKKFDKLRHTRLITILSYLDFHKEGVNPSQMAEDLNIARPHLTRVIDSMESDNILERKLSSEDKRRFVLFITEKGKAQLQQRRDEDMKRCEILCSRLSENEIIAALELFKKINDFTAEEIGIVKDVPFPLPLDERTQHKKHKHNEGDTE